jgi:hypothetical protein
MRPARISSIASAMVANGIGGRLQDTVRGKRRTILQSKPPVQLGGGLRQALGIPQQIP